MRGRGPRLRGGAVTPWLLLLPSFAFLAVFTLFPIFKTIYLSFFQSDLGAPHPVFIGLSDYSQLMKDPIFWRSLENNLLFALGTVPVSIALGLLMAECVNRKLKAGGLVQTLFFYPVIIPLIAVANIWSFLYSASSPLAAVLAWFHVYHFSPLSQSGTVLAALIVMIVWKEAGFYMIFYLAALKNLPQEVYEAAEIDGIPPFYRFRKVTFPLLMPTTLFCLVMATANAFKLVDHLVVMTQGGPDNASNMLLYYIYQMAFQFMDNGKAATLTIVVLLLLTVIFCVQFFSTDRKIHYD
ncbi:MAG: sugar ABC transporter permease [Sporolactobacillus sp.]